MVGAVQTAGVGAPHHLSEDQHEDKEENSDHFQEDDVPHPAKRFEKSAHAARQASRGTARGAAGRSPGGRTIRGIDRQRPGSGSTRRITGRRLRGASQVLPGHAAGHANANSQYPADGLRFHTRYDGSSGAERET